MKRFSKEISGGSGIRSSSTSGVARDSLNTIHNYNPVKLDDDRASVPVPVPAAAATLPRKQVFNPYAKPSTRQTSQRKAVRNPYAKRTKFSSVAPMTVVLKNISTNHWPTMKSPGASAEYTEQKELCNPLSVKNMTRAVSGKLPPQLIGHQTGISISLPMMERLPSRNVSYRPAEIMTVDELYRYLYHFEMCRGDKDAHEDEIKKTEKGEGRAAYGDDSNYVVSIRITGTMLCVSTSNKRDGNNNEATRSLFNDGTYILVGDPLENTRFAKTGLPAEQHKSIKGSSFTGNNSSTTTSAGVATTPCAPKATPNAGLTSILSNERSPSTITAKMSTAMPFVAETPSAAPTSTSNRTTAPSFATRTAIVTTPARNSTQSNNSATNLNNTGSRSKSILNCGSRILNNGGKRKRLVYNGGRSSGERLSLGAEMGEHGGGGLLGERGYPQKRAGNSMITKGPSPALLSIAKKRDVIDTSGRLGLPGSLVKTKRGTTPSTNTIGKAVSGNNPMPEYIIQCHPSPIVPIWIGGPYFDDDGLDGSIVGDLVMIMGEIVVERCVNCHQKSNDAAEEASDDHNGDNDEGNKAYEGAPSANAGRTSGASDENHGTHPKEGLHKPPPATAIPMRIQSVKHAATSIAIYAQKISNAGSPIASQTPQNVNRRKRNFCNRCTRFIKARFTKNANGTDMSLHREVLHMRRAYMAERKRQMMIMSNNDREGLYSIGCGPPVA